MVEVLTGLYSGSQGRIPEPEKKITELEDAWIKQHGVQGGGSQLASKMANLSVIDTADTFFPTRPQFGTGGTPIVLWANYFKMNTTVKSLFKYDLRVTAKKLTKADEEALEKQSKGKARPNQPQEGQQSDNKEAKGKKLTKVIELALEKLKPALLATEYKQQLITKEKLPLPADRFLQIDLVEPGRNPETWFVRFDGPSSIDVSGLMGYLQTLEDTGNDAVFPKYPDEIDALGVVLGHTPRSNPNTAAVGRSRFFAVDPTRKDQAPNVPPLSLIEILRGYVQSVRPTTGRLLLNVNTTHGVFRKEFPLAQLFEKFKTDTLDKLPSATPQIKGRLENQLLTLNRFLSRSRIRCRIPGDKRGEFVTTERTMAGLAFNRDGRREDQPPQFRDQDFLFACPISARFYLRAPKDQSTQHPNLIPHYGKHIVVAQYYKLSKCPFSIVLASTPSNSVRVQHQRHPRPPADQCRHLDQADLHPGRILRSDPRSADKVEADGK